MKIKLPLPFGLALLLAGCVPSVNPLYTEKDLVFDPALVGVWSEENEKEAWAFAEAGGKKYFLKHTDSDGRTGEFDAHLLKLGQELFLDLYALGLGGNGGWEINQLARCALVIRPGHLFLKVDQITPTLKLRLMDPERLEELIEKNPKDIQHEKIRLNGRDSEEFQIILTAPTKDLQKFILRHVKDEKFFADPGTLTKKPKPVDVEPVNK